PAPGAVKNLRARRKLHNVTVTWGGVSGAKSYVVRLSSRHGTKVAKLVPGRSHSTVFTAIRIDDKLKIDVRALAASMRGGPRRSVTVRPGRQ
ncbi:MAG: hypothetical protein QOJ07_2340, partial [Thermoleophilaceae bacterium]|nr:hypothetical protein [Thermoleophilaceae bacterium]